MSTVPTWLAITQSTATTLGVLIALYVAVWREPRKARSERDDRKKQLTALQRAEDERVIAQARRVVASVGSVSLLGNGVWFASVSNHSTAPVTNLEVEVFAVDAKGERIPEPCKRSKETIGTDDVFAKFFRQALSGGLSSALGSQFGGYGSGLGQLAGQTIAPQVQSAFREALRGHLPDEFQSTLTPEQDTTLAYTLPAGATRLSMRITFIDEAGYRWSRTDHDGPQQAVDVDLDK